MWRDLWSDYRRYPGSGLARLRIALSSPGFWAIANYRFRRRLHSLPGWARKPLKLLFAPAALLVRLATGIELPDAARIGPGLYIGHFGAIIVSGGAVLGERCNLSPCVTVGRGARGGVVGAPRIGDRVYIAPGARVFGPISIGSDSAIGANAVVNEDVPPGVSVAGIPARIVSGKGSRELIELKPLPDLRVSPIKVT